MIRSPTVCHMAQHPNDELEHLNQVKRWTQRNPREHQQTEASLQLLTPSFQY